MNGTIERSCKKCDFKVRFTYQFTCQINPLAWNRMHKAAVEQLELQIAEHTAEKRPNRRTGQPTSI